MRSDVNQMLESIINGEDRSSYQVFFLGQGQKQSLEDIYPCEILVDGEVQGWSRKEFVALVEALEDAEFLPIQELDDGAAGVIRYVPTREIPLLDNWIGQIAKDDRLPELSSFDGM